jgi:hypothetical protein
MNLMSIDVLSIKQQILNVVLAKRKITQKKSFRKPR